MNDREADELRDLCLEKMKEITYRLCQENDDKNDFDLEYLTQSIQEKITPDVELVPCDDYSIGMNFTLNSVIVENILQEYTNFLYEQELLNKDIKDNDMVTLFINHKIDGE